MEKQLFNNKYIISNKNIKLIVFFMMEQNKNTESYACDLYNKVLNGEMSLEQAAKVLAEYPIIAKTFADML